MTSLELDGFAAQRPDTSVLGGALSIFAPVKRWYDRRQTLFKLSHLDEHVLRDLGFEPSDVCDALEGKDSPLLQKLSGKPEVR